ncbi:MAG: MucB/RseB C-terminal domain-containing protein [Marinobacterium sp.]
MQKAKESLSALVDGEVSDFELRRTVETVADSSELQQQWRRYQVARACLKREPQAELKLDLSKGVMDAIRDEPVYHPSIETASTVPARVQTRGQSWWRSLTSMAVAASVTAAVILGAGNFEDDAPQSPQFYLPGQAASPELMRTRLGGPIAPAGYESPDVIRLSDGLKKYIDQHQHLLSTQRVPQWTTRWLPKGYAIVRHELLPHGEVMVFANGRDAFSVSVEELGHQSMPEGVAQSDGYIAVGKRQGDHFVTVVGDVPLMIAERIASAVQPEATR